MGVLYFALNDHLWVIIHDIGEQLMIVLGLLLIMLQGQLREPDLNNLFEILALDHILPDNLAHGTHNIILAVAVHLGLLLANRDLQGLIKRGDALFGLFVESLLGLLAQDPDPVGSGLSDRARFVTGEP